ncbi:MAG: phytoene desaturase family protein [Candidatus Freyarchaeota archaeon]
MHDFLNSVCMLYFAIPYYRASAGEYLHCFKKMFLDSSFGYVRGGSASISKAFLEAAKKHGAETKTSTQAKRIIVENGNLVGVELTGGEIIKSTLVISNAGVKETVFKLIGEKHFTKEYIKYVRNFKESLGFLSFRIALKGKVTDKPCHVVMTRCNACECSRRPMRWYLLRLRRQLVT